DQATYARPSRPTLIAGLSSKPNLTTGRATRRTVQAPVGPARLPTTRYGVRSGPGAQIDFSVNATYCRPSLATATAGSPQAHVLGSNAGPAVVFQVRPPFVEEYTRISGSSVSFDAPKRTFGFDGSTATATSVWTPGSFEMFWTFVPATFQGL